MGTILAAPIGVVGAAVITLSVIALKSELASQLASSLQPLWPARGRIREGLTWFDAVLTDESIFTDVSLTIKRAMEKTHDVNPGKQHIATAQRGFGFRSTHDDLLWVTFFENIT